MSKCFKKQCVNMESSYHKHQGYFSEQIKRFKFMESHEWNKNKVDNNNYYPYLRLQRCVRMVANVNSYDVYVEGHKVKYYHIYVP